MGTSSRALGELDREELIEEVSRLRELERRVQALEELVGTLGDTAPEEADFKDTTLAGSPVGVMVDKNNRRFKELKSAIEDDKGGNARLSGAREQMLPIHRMWNDFKSGSGHSLSVTQKRAARIFGEVVARVVNDEANLVDASGQVYTLSSGAVEEILLGEHDEKSLNLLKGVKKESRSQIVARAMRDVARLSKFGDCECEDIDSCSHSEVKFRSGRPNVLAAPKTPFHELMEQVYNSQANKDGQPNEGETESQ